MPDGTNFAYKNKNDAEPTGSGITLNKKSKGSDIGSASNVIIPDSAKKNNTSDKKVQKKFSRADLRSPTRSRERSWRGRLRGWR